MHPERYIPTSDEPLTKNQLENCEMKAQNKPLKQHNIKLRKKLLKIMLLKKKKYTLNQLMPNKIQSDLY